MTEANIHPLAIVDPNAQVDFSAHIGPFCIIGPDVVIGPEVVLKSHVVVSGRTKINLGTVIFPFAVIGEVPQDLKFNGEDSRLEIGKRNRIREHVTINSGTERGGNVTRIGNDCMFMAGCHIAHDASIGNRVVVVNGAGVAGHCVLEDDVILGGLSGVHQFVRIGRGAVIGAVTMVTHDVIPFGLVHGPRGGLHGLNLVGLKRNGVDRVDITALQAAYQMLAQGDGTFHERAALLGSETDSKYVKKIIDFVMGDSDRSFLSPH